MLSVRIVHSVEWLLVDCPFGTLRTGVPPTRLPDYLHLFGGRGRWKARKILREHAPERALCVVE